MKFKELRNRGEQLLFPPSLDEYVPANDLVRYVDGLIEELDLDAIESSYSERGCRAYSPRVLVKLIVYGKLRGIRSSRGLAQSLRENVRFMYLCQGQEPDFRTINRFRKRFSEELGQCLAQTVHLGIKAGLVKGETLCIDGTKLRAFASNNSFMSEDKLKERLAELEQEAAKSFEQDSLLDEQEDSEYGEDDDGDPKLPKSLEDKKALKDKIRKALAEFEKAQEKNNYKPLKTSLTDPDSRILQTSDGGSAPCYNAQAAVDAGSDFVLGGIVSNAGSDHGMLQPTLDDAIETSKLSPNSVAADAGYGKHAPLKEISDRGIEVYVPIPQTIKQFSFEHFEYDQEQDEFVCPNNRRLKLLKPKFKKSWKNPDKKMYECEDCSGCPLRDKCLKNPDKQKARKLQVTEFSEFVLAMRAKVSSLEGKEMMKLRAQTVEPVFGILKYAKQLQRFYFRGLERVQNEWKLELAARNIEKLANWRAATA